MITISFNKKSIVTDSWKTPHLNLGEQGRQFYDSMSDGQYVAEIKQRKGKRSLDSNSYLWVLCHKMAEKLGSTKLEVYRQAIKDVGVFFDMAVPKGEEEQAKRTWESNGDGWLLELEQETEKYVKFKAYKGSSVYDSREMAFLLDHIVREANEIGIETATPREIEEMKRGWK